MRRDVELRSHAYRFHAPRGAERSSRRSLSPPLRPRALLRGVGALNVLDQCSARSPRSVLEMVGASSRRTPRLPLTKGTRDRNAVEKRWWPARRIFPIFGAVLSLARGALAIECIWYPFFPVASRGNPADTRGRTTSLRSVVPAPVRSSRGQASRRPRPPARSPPQAPRAQGVRRTGPARGSERRGRLGATPGDAPVASTPPRRREPGR